MRERRKIIVAMSGGIDSSVAAALLKKAGFEVIGVFMKFWLSTQINTDRNTDEHRYENRCCSIESENRARKVAKILKIPFYVFNFEKEFKKRVVDYFVKEYKQGRTPNPCVVCNKEIKFGLLLKKALALDADFIATGHYAKKSKVKSQKLKVGQITNKACELKVGQITNKACELKKVIYKLLRGKDKIKDQSYFLWQLNQEQLKHILFPLGNYTKDQIRDLARKFKLPFLNIPESQEICFINTNLNEFLRSRIKTKRGDIITIERMAIQTQGQGSPWVAPQPLLGGETLARGSGPLDYPKVIGKHQGLPFYTIGQRRGIELSGGPFYVVEKDFKKNNLIVAPSFDDKSLYGKTLIAKEVNWISGQEPKLPLKIKAQIRYGHEATPAIIMEHGTRNTKHVTRNTKHKTYEIIFDKPQRAITPGQSVVFYKNREVLGGGIISME